MNKNEVKEVLRELNIATGFRISLHDVTTGEVCAAPTKPRDFCAKIQEDPDERALCEKCDRAACKKALSSGNTYCYKCRYGLTEIVSPIYNFGKHVGFLMMGQTFEAEGERTAAESKLLSLGLTEAEKDSLINQIPIVKRELASSFAKILTICAKYLTLSGAVYNTDESIPDAAMRFIRENYSKKLMIKDICSALGCSKTTLLSSFKKVYKITVNSALNKVRLDAAKKQISSPHSPSINVVALSVGFSDQSYFCKVFSQEYGESPSEYKKRIEKRKRDEYSFLPSACTKK